MKSSQQKKINNVGNRGAALLIAMLISSIVLAVGVGVYNRTYKGLIFASFWKQAQTAFSSADAGLECAMYWDKNPLTPATCFDQTVSGPLWTPGSSGAFTVPVANGCVNVNVTRFTPTPPDTITTRIESRGYNDVCDSTNPRRVERGLGVQY